MKYLFTYDLNRKTENNPEELNQLINEIRNIVLERNQNGLGVTTTEILNDPQFQNLLEQGELIILENPNHRQVKKELSKIGILHPEIGYELCPIRSSAYFITDLGFEELYAIIQNDIITPHFEQTDTHQLAIIP